MNSESATLYKKLAIVASQLTRLKKDGKNAHFGYAFVTDASVADTIRRKLAAQNVAFSASMIGFEQRDIERAGKSGARSFIHTIATFEFAFMCGDTGAVHAAQWTGEAFDDQDKGLNKAATAAEKYFLLKFFMLSTGDTKDDPDSSAVLDIPQKTVSTPRSTVKPGDVHWTKNGEAPVNFLKWANKELSMTEKECFEALSNVTNEPTTIHDWQGSKNEAMAACVAWASGYLVDNVYRYISAMTFSESVKFEIDALAQKYASNFNNSVKV